MVTSPTASQVPRVFPRTTAVVETVITHLPDSSPLALAMALRGLGDRDWTGTTGWLLEVQGTMSYSVELSIPLQPEEGDLILSNITSARMDSPDWETGSVEDEPHYE